MIFEKYVERTLGKIEHTLELYGRHIFMPLCEVSEVLALETGEHLRLPPEDACMTPIAPGRKWGWEYGNMWLKCRVSVPREAAGLTLCAIPKCDAAEVLCFKNGVPAGIINSKNRFIGGNHSVMFVSKDAVPGEEIELAFECYAGHSCLGTQPVENYDADEDSTDQDAFRHIYQGITLCAMNETVKDAVFDLSTALQLARLKADNFVSQKAYQALANALPYIIQDQRGVDQSEITESARHISGELAPVLKKTHGDASRGLICMTGHSHMDTAWLWPVSETIRKCARTYSQALTLMDMYPDYTFIQSSALHLDWMRRYYPAIFEGIKRRAKEGRYEPNGGVWVECDCNITGGEAMARQFIYGQRFTRKYLDYTSDCFWLPDTFGYSAAIPQIMLQSGVKYFYTTKLSWNDLNTFPAGTFVWKGIDGSEVLCHLNATHSIPDPKTITEYYANVSDRRTEDRRFAAYGFGDGGGGPTYGMLEYFKRVKDLEGMPVIRSCSASRFMQEIEPHQDKLPMCDGELYLELHRGTLTKMHDVKKNNRLAEIALHDYELLSVLSGQGDAEAREVYWKTLLKNQFHDILPGTCIPKVYEAEIPEMNKLIEDVNADTARFAGLIGESEENTVSAFNTLCFDRSDAIELSGSWEAEGCPSQTYADMDGALRTKLYCPIPAMDSAVLKLRPAASVSESVFTVSGTPESGLEVATPFYHLRFDVNGFIAYLYDSRARRQVNAPGGAIGTLYFGEEMSAAWDNWDIDNDAFEKLAPVIEPERFKIVSNGSVELRTRGVYRLGRSSRVTLDTVLYAHSRRIDYELKVDWQERHGLLKAAFDLNIRSAFVKNEIQFGNLDRPTTRNNAIEAAKFEVCNQKWSDLSETHYGAAVLNDCKYGISAQGSCMMLTLMKGGSRPDPKTDLGVHTMRYALLPHEGAFSAESVVREAYAFNFLPKLFSGVFKAPKLFEIDAPGVICEAVKPADDVPDAYVLRLYECERNHTNAKLKLYSVKKACVTNFLEEKTGDLPLNADGACELEFSPFEIKTLLVER